MSHDDHATEPIPGLPELPPQGETILWQGSPHWPTLARRVMHLDLVAAYLVLILGWRALGTLGSGLAGVQSLLVMLTVMAVGFAMLALLARGMARSTIYTITNRRVVLRYGIALPITFNLPFSVIASAGVRDLGKGRGDIALKLAGGQRLAYLVLWPHVRPWRLRSPEPMLRCVPDAPAIATLLGEALSVDAKKVGSALPPIRITSVAPSDGLVRPALVAAE